MAAHATSARDARRTARGARRAARVEHYADARGEVVSRSGRPE
jgi:hypothetical protein